MNIIYMGTSDFAVPALYALAEDEACDLALVVSQPDRPRGRGGKFLPTPVKKAAEQLGIDVVTPDKIKDNQDFVSEIDSLRPDLIVVASYGKILPSEILAIPTFGCVNIHASLLPEYRGAAPIQWAICDGKDETGISLMYMAEGLDTGDVIARSKVSIGSKDAGELTEELAQLGAKMLVSAIPDIASGSADRMPQDHSLSTYARMIAKEDGHIDWSLPASSIVRKIQGMTPAPGAWMDYRGTKIKLLKAQAIEAAAVAESAACGTIVNVSFDGIEVMAGKGRVLINVIGVPGKKPMQVSEYLKGNKIDNWVLLR